MPILGGGGGAVSSLSANLTATQIAALNSSPVTLLAAQGAGRVIVPMAAAFQYKPGSVAFAASASTPVRVGGTGGPTPADPGFNTLTAKVTTGGVSTGGLVANSPLTVGANDPIDFAGPILTSSLGAGGSGYSAGDTGTVNGGVALAAYVVDTVDGGGAVLTYHLTSAGQGYAIADGVGTAVVTGGGDGLFTINVLTITNASNGTGRVQVLYYVMALA